MIRTALLLVRDLLRQRSTVAGWTSTNACLHRGIAKGSVDAGAVARGVLADNASIYHVEI
jgi:hypothetical protein